MLTSINVSQSSIHYGSKFETVKSMIDAGKCCLLKNSRYFISTIRQNKEVKIHLRDDNN